MDAVCGNFAAASGRGSHFHSLGQALDNKYIFANINFNFGYVCQLGRDMHAAANTVVIGVNLIAVSFVYILGKTQKTANVSLFALAVLLATYTLSRPASVYQCADTNGQTVSQDQPCRLSGEASSAIKSASVPFHAHLLIVESNADIERWVITPSDKRRPDTARHRHVRWGQQLLIPAVVTDYAPDTSGLIKLSADFQLVSPTGRIIIDTQQFASSNAQDPRTPGLIVLNPVLNLTLDPTDPLGSYIVRATVRDGNRSAQVEENFELGE